MKECLRWKAIPFIPFWPERVLHFTSLTKRVRKIASANGTFCEIKVSVGHTATRHIAKSHWLLSSARFRLWPILGLLR